jgi:nucleoside-diphosphate-sugar epimerase
MSTIETVAVTGGNGKIGRAILRELDEHGYHTANVARGKRREEVSDEYRRTDLLTPGDVYGSLAAADPDALIHMGTIPGPTSNPGHTVYESNVMSTYVLVEAAGALGIDRICLASSINALGSVYQEAPMDVRYLPVDEDHPRTPRDPYAMGKHALEVTADGFGRRPDAPDSIVSLRYPWVATGEEMEERLADRDRSLGADNVAASPGHRDELFSYLHIDDGAAVARLAIEHDVGGHEVLWTVADDTTVTTPTSELLGEYPDAEVRGEFDRFEALIDVSKAEELLGWEPRRSWRDYRD